MEKKSAEERKEWVAQARRGALQSFTYFRRLLRQGGELSLDDREGLIYSLNNMEEHLVGMWPLVDAIEADVHKRMTRQSTKKLRNVT